MNKYDIIDHTADIGLKAYGKDLSEAFENAAIGMFDIITDNSEIVSKEKQEIKLKSDDIEQLLVDWLSELVFLNSARNLVFGKFDVELDEKNCELSAEIFGEEYDTSKHSMGAEIKAVTYHMLEVKKEPKLYVQVLFDI